MEMAIKARELAKPDATKDGGGRMHENDKEMIVVLEMDNTSFFPLHSSPHSVCGLQI